jgi:hypothetical protein
MTHHKFQTYTVETQLRSFVCVFRGITGSLLHPALGSSPQVIGWVTKNLLSRAPPCFGRHVKPLVPAAFAVVSIHQPTHWDRVLGYDPFFLCVIYQEGLCPSSADISRLMMMMISTACYNVIDQILFCFWSMTL